MKFYNRLMADSNEQHEKIGDFVKRSKRNIFAEQNEQLIRELAPYPASYDVTQTQDLDFSEYTYTELLSGAWVKTQCLEINAKLLQSLAHEKSDEGFCETLLTDKYDLSEDIGKWKKHKKVVFLAGHNLLSVASIEQVHRIMHENDDAIVKPHPITNAETLDMLGKRFGWNKIVPKDISGNALLRNADTVYTTSASEMAISGTLLGKKVVNISDFFHEGNGVYHSIARIIFNAKDKNEAKQLTINLINNPRSGIIMPYHTDLEDRLTKYYDYSLQMREIHRPIASPRFNGHPEE